MVKFKANRRVTVIVPGWSKNDQGGLEADEVGFWDKWAMIEDRTGSNQFSNQQQVWTYDYKVTMRRERTRPTQSNYEIEYDGVRMKIESVTIDSEGFQHFEICRCSKVDAQVTIDQSS